jgi:hypothetical protein
MNAGYMKVLLFVLMFWGIHGNVCLLFSLSLDTLLGAETAEQLVLEGKLTRDENTTEPDMAPRYEPLSRILRQNIETVEPNVITESLYLYTKPPYANREAWTVEERGAIYNETLAISALTGLEYFSHRRNRMRTFYESSHVVDGTDTKRILPDPVYQTPPQKLSLYVRQKDMTFGDNVYMFTYEADESAFIITQENASTIMFAFVPIVGKKNMRSVVALLDAGPYLLIYSVSLARVLLLPGIKDRVNISIGNRTAALLGWFSQRADIAYAKARRDNP